MVYNNTDLMSSLIYRKILFYSIPELHESAACFCFQSTDRTKHLKLIKTKP